MKDVCIQPAAAPQHVKVDNPTGAYGSCEDAGYETIPQDNWHNECKAATLALTGQAWRKDQGPGSWNHVPKGCTVYVGQTEHDWSQTYSTTICAPPCTGWTDFPLICRAGAYPSAWSAPSGTIATGTSITMTFSGGRGLNLAAGQDAAKVVLSSGDCSSAAAGGGTSEVTDLGPDDSTSATSASAAFTWTSAGMYKVCYKLAGGSYAQVGTSAITVTPPAVCSNSTQWDQSRSVCVATLRGIIDACKKERGGWSYTCNSKGDAAIAALPAGEASGPTDPTQRATLCNNATTVYDNNAAQCVASYARSANSCIENVLTSSTSGRIECGTYSNGNK